MKLTLTIFLLLLGSLIFAQPTDPGPDPVDRDYRIKGKVIEEGTNLPLEFATVSFIDQSGNVVTGGITDIDGNYDIKVPGGIYDIQFDFISYKSVTLEDRRIDRNTTLPAVSMTMDSATLDEVVVTAETTEVQVRLDKRIYNIGKDLTTSGATVSDALNNVPSVTVDVDGAINLRGNSNVRILINGRPSAIAGFGSTDALQQLPAEVIEKVEVITSPSARYDAEGTAGILNIVLKKDKTLGFNGSIQALLGVPINSGLTTNINLRSKKFNIFNTTGLRYRNAPGNAFFENIYFSESRPNPLVIEDRQYDRQDQGLNSNLGIEYFLTETSSLTATGFVRLGDDEDETENVTDEFDRMGLLDVTRIRTELETEEDLNYQFALSYRNELGDNGHLLTADFQYGRGEETQTSFIEERNEFPNSQNLPAEDITETEDETEILLQADYVRPIGEDAQFEAGFRSQMEDTETDFLLLEQFTTGGPFIRNDSISNTFNFSQDVHALYTQYGDKIGKFSFLLGLRMEATLLKGEVSGEDVSSATGVGFDANFDKEFIGLFPTVNLIYELNDMENLTLGYNRRINRPRSWFLNPFPSRSSEANVFQGNPGLNPAFASAFDLGYLKRWKKFTLTSSVYFQYETDAFERVQEDTGLETPNGIPIIRTIPINLSTNQRIGFEAGVLYNPLKWLRFNGSFNFFRFSTEGSFNGIEYGAENTSWFARASTKVSLPSRIEWQTNMFYRGPRNNAQTDTEGIFSINLALSKDIINDNGTIGVNVRDLFNSRIRRQFTETESFISDSEFQWRVRQVTFSFVYRFNQKKERQRGGRDGGGFGDDGGFEG